MGLSDKSFRLVKCYQWDMVIFSQTLYGCPMLSLTWFPNQIQLLAKTHPWCCPNFSSPNIFYETFTSSVADRTRRGMVWSSLQLGRQVSKRMGRIAESVCLCVLPIVSWCRFQPDHHDIWCLKKFSITITGSFFQSWPLGRTMSWW